MSVGGITRSPTISITDDDQDEEEQELEQELYTSALQSSIGINSDDPNSPDSDPNDPATISTGTSAISVGNQGSQGAGGIGESRGTQATEALRSTLSSDDRVSEPAPARSQTTQTVIGMRGGTDPMLAIYDMEAQHDSAPEPNIVRSKDNVG